MVKNLPVVQETQESSIRSLGQEYPLEEKIAIHSSILAWEIPWTEEPDVPQSTGLPRVGHDCPAAGKAIILSTFSRNFFFGVTLHPRGGTWNHSYSLVDAEAF